MDYAHVISHFGSCTAAAQAIGRDVRIVNKWKHRIPLEAQVLFEAYTDGALKADLPKYFRKQAA